MNAATVLAAEALRPVLPDGQSCAALDFSAVPGRLVCLIGPGGGGKTTWLRTLAGVDPPATGRLALLGQDVGRLDTPGWRRLRCRAAFLAAGAPLLSVVDGLNNVMLPALYHRLGSPETVRAQALETLAYLDYRGSSETLPAYLSPHQRLLLAIARCLMLSPELLFLDEPFHMTDDACRRREAEIYRRLTRERGLSMFVATHNLGFVKRQADDILFVHAGGVRCFAGWQALTADTEPPVREFLAGVG